MKAMIDQWREDFKKLQYFTYKLTLSPSHQSLNLLYRKGQAQNDVREQKHKKGPV